MTIPEIRERLLAKADETGDNELRMLAKADETGDNELRMLADELKRRSPRARAKPCSVTVTPALRRAIVAYKDAHTDVAQTEIARLFHVNPGRVSEALNGFRQ